MIDNNLKPWLIEINGPPQLTIDSYKESKPVSKMIDYSASMSVESRLEPQISQKNLNSSIITQSNTNMPQKQINADIKVKYPMIRDMVRVLFETNNKIIS